MSRTRITVCTVFFLTGALLTTVPARSDENRADGPPRPIATDLDPMNYLSAVREQRQALAERRRQEIQEHPPEPPQRPIFTPWNTTLQEQVEQRREMARDAMESRSEWRNQVNRALRYWHDPLGARLEEIHNREREAMEAQAEQRREHLDRLREERANQRPPRPPVYSPYPNNWPAPWMHPGY